MKSVRDLAQMLCSGLSCRSASFSVVGVEGIPYNDEDIRIVCRECGKVQSFDIQYCDIRKHAQILKTA